MPMKRAPGPIAVHCSIWWSPFEIAEGAGQRNRKPDVIVRLSACWP
jgi:hypothetical protein